MKPEFKVFKSGRTPEPVTILSNPNEPFDREAKIKKYLALGYKVYDLSGKEIH